MIERQEWIEHKFNLGMDLGWSKNILTRITDTAIRLEHYASNLTDKQLSIKANGKWSIKEHIGHLTDLESLWLNRFRQFERHLPELMPADMSNKKTESADHNKCHIGQLLKDFKAARKELTLVFNNMTEDSLRHQAFHPRIKIVMRPVDLLFFIAEHDDHHIASITGIKTAITTSLNHE